MVGAQRATTELDRSLLRRLAEWDPRGAPVTSILLNVDGRRYPRRGDYEVRLDRLLRTARERAAGLGREAQRSVECDAGAIAAFVRERFDRGSTRGLALYACHAAGLWEAVRLRRPVRDRAVVAPEPELRPLEALLETYPSICTALVDSARGRILLSELGRIVEETDVLDEVPGRHDQGGWSQMRYQRHVDDHRQRHLKHVADVLFRRFRDRPFDHLVLAGPAEVVAELERELHDYLRRRIRARIPLSVQASAEQVLERSLALEEELTRERDRERVALLAEQAAAGRSAVAGLDATLAALSEGRVAELVVDLDLAHEGAACGSCGRLSLRPGPCPTCDAAMEPVNDVVDAAVALALRQGARVETVDADGELADLGGVGAFLRF